MKSPVATRAAVNEFLGRKRLALVGISRNRDDFTRAVFRELAGRGYDVVPVNPAAAEIEGRKCFSSVAEISPGVDTALIMTAPAVTEQVVRACSSAGISRVWMHRGAGKGAVSQTAIDYCKSHGINVVAGQCPMMFLEGVGAVHGIHAFFKRLVGSYPK